MKTVPEIYNSITAQLPPDFEHTDKIWTFLMQKHAVITLRAHILLLINPFRSPDITVDNGRSQTQGNDHIAVAKHRETLKDIEAMADKALSDVKKLDLPVIVKQLLTSESLFDEPKIQYYFSTSGGVIA